MSRMRLVPFSRPFMRDWYDWSHAYDDSFADFDDEMAIPRSRYLMRTSPSAFGNRAGFANSDVKTDGKQFKVTLDVNQFSPKEIDVKIIDGNIIVHGKHEEKVDEHGVVSREFTRRYKMPQGIDPSSVTSSLRPDGCLTISVPLSSEATTERVVPITVGNVQQSKLGSAADTCQPKEGDSQTKVGAQHAKETTA